MSPPSGKSSPPPSGSFDSRDGDPSEAPTGADLGPGLGRDFPLRLELVLNDDASAGGDDASPFVVLSDYGGNSRVYLGRILSGHPSSNRYVAVKMQMPRPPEEASEDYGGILTHRVRERRWLREVDHYRAVRTEKGGFTPLYFVEPAPERSDLEDQPRPWPPLLFLRDEKILFQPLSEKGLPLETCRDSKLLIANGLPDYESSVETFLYSPREAESGEAPVFYQNAG